MDASLMARMKELKDQKPPLKKMYAEEHLKADRFLLCFKSDLSSFIFITNCIITL